jgi:hypothetical protein
MSTESHAIAWIPVLDRIEQRLLESLAQAPLPEPASPPGQDPLGDPLARLQDPLGQAQQRLVGIAADVADTDALLAAAAMDLRQWQDHFVASKQKLTDWATGLGSAGTVPSSKQ